MNDNRDYKYPSTSITERPEYPLIANWIGKRSKVIDLGCGDGSLLAYLKRGKRISNCVGLEISSSGVKASRKKGIETIQGRIDQKLPFKNKEFDFAICNVTLQMVMYPEILLKEMSRISKKQIITFPNFAFLLNRLELLFLGRMPKFMIPGYEWFSTGHIHQLSIKDFEVFCKNNKIKIEETRHIFPKNLFLFKMGLFKAIPNLFANIGVFLTS